MRLGLDAEGVPAAVPHFEVHDALGGFVGRVDLGWKEAKVASGYQGDHHRTDRDQWMRDQARFADSQRRVAGVPLHGRRPPVPHAFAVRVLAAFAARGC